MLVHLHSDVFREKPSWFQFRASGGPQNFIQIQFWRSQGRNGGRAGASSPKRECRCPLHSRRMGETRCENDYAKGQRRLSKIRLSRQLPVRCLHSQGRGYGSCSSATGKIMRSVASGGCARHILHVTRPSESTQTAIVGNLVARMTRRLQSQVL